MKRVLTIEMCDMHVHKVRKRQLCSTQRWDRRTAGTAWQLQWGSLFLFLLRVFVFVFLV